MMKKLILTVALASAAAFVSAQDMMSKRGTPILPEAGDWSLGFDAAPLLNYFGNLFDQTGNNSANARYQETQTIVGKMMKDENTALRVKIRLGIGSTKVENLVSQDGATTATATVADSWKSSSTNVTIGAGLQKYRGKGRLKGFYGAEAGIMFGGGKHTYDFGNAFVVASPTGATSTDWTMYDPATGTYASSIVSNRITEEKDGSSFGVSIRGFVGVEYFFAPKLSISAEYGWGLGLTSTGEGEVSGESFDGTTTTTSTAKTGKSSNFGIDVDNVGGAIVLSAYF